MLILILILLFAVVVPARELQELTTPSWDSLPLFFHSTNVSGLWSSASIERMKVFPLITFDKGQGSQNISDTRPGEFRALDAARAVRAALGPSVSLFFYQNSLIDWPEFSAHSLLVADASLRALNATGRDALFQQHWLFNAATARGAETPFTACLSVVANDGGETYNGCFFDRADDCKFDKSCGLGVEAVMSEAQHVAFAAGHRASLINATSALAQRGQIAIWNNNIDSDHDTFMLEDFGANESCILVLMHAATQGQMVEAHAGDLESGSDNHCENITNALAAFLIGAGPNSYFACSNAVWTSNPAWPAERDAWLDSRPEYEKSLGVPQGNATKTAAGVWQRLFASGTRVEFIVATGAGRIEWSDGTVDQGVGSREPNNRLACQWSAALLSPQQ
jgi:Hypothetical glycosyl hydrolase family 15